MSRDFRKVQTKVLAHAYTLLAEKEQELADLEWAIEQISKANSTKEIAKFFMKYINEEDLLADL